MLITANAVASAPGIAGAAPKNYCADLKGVDNGQTGQPVFVDPTTGMDPASASSRNAPRALGSARSTA